MPTGADRPVYAEVIEELRLALLGTDVPLEVRECALRLVQRVEKCLLVVPVVAGALGASEVRFGFHSSDLLLDLLAAVRAREWPRVMVLERHEITSNEQVVLLRIETVLRSSGLIYWREPRGVVRELAQEVLREISPYLSRPNSK